MRRTAFVLLLIVLAVGVEGAQVMPEWEEGTAAFRRGEYANAATLFDTVTQRQPAYAPGHYMFGLSLWKLGQPHEALPRLRRAVDQAAAEGYRFALALGQLLVELDDEGEALPVLRLLTPERLEAGEEAAYGAVLAPVAAATGMLAEEVARWQGRPVVLFPLAEALAAERRADEAFAAYLQAGRDGTAGVALRRAYALAMSQAEADPATWYPRAEQAAAALAAADPAAADAWSWQGQLLVNRKEFAAALAAFDAAREHGGDPFTVGYWRGQAAAELGRWSEALADFDAALAAAADGDRARVQARRAQALHELGRLSEAVAAYRAAGREQPAAALEAALAAQSQAEAGCRELARELADLVADAAAAGIDPVAVRQRLIGAHPECAAFLQGP
jgi:tetratricopeptide (TPR) repeat protein